MSTDLAIREPQAVTLSNDQLQYIASTEFVPVGLRGNLPAILACVATGRALGLPDMTALRSIHIIDGKATFSAELMVMLVRRQGHSITGEVTQGGATAVGKRADNEDTITVRWTLEMADRAGLLGKSNWKKYPESMLWARAVSQLCRMLFADCMGGGATYTPEELGDDEDHAAERPPGDGTEALDTGRKGSPLEEESPSRPRESSGGEPSADASAPQSVAPEADQAASPPEDPAAGTPFAYDIDATVHPPGSEAPKYISVKQRERLFTIAGKCGVEEPQIREIVREFTGQESTKQIEVGRVYEGIIAAIQAKAAA